MLMTSPLFHLNFWGVHVEPDRQCWGQPEPKAEANQPKYSNLCDQHTWKSQTDRQTT